MSEFGITDHFGQLIIFSIPSSEFRHSSYVPSVNVTIRFNHFMSHLRWCFEVVFPITKIKPKNEKYDKCGEKHKLSKQDQNLVESIQL